MEEQVPALAQPGSDPFAVNDQASIKNKTEKLKLDLKRPSSNNSASCEVSTGTSPAACHLIIRDKRRWRSPEVLLCDPVLQTDFYSQVICKYLSTYDSEYNMFRTVTVTRLNNSLLYHSLSRYLTMAYLGPTQINANNDSLLQHAQADTLHRLQHWIFSLCNMSANIDDCLTAVIMFGLSASWDGTRDPGLMHYNAAVSIFHKRQQNKIVSSSEAELRKEQFFREALVYWWMGLCFVIDITHEHLADPPLPNETAPRTSGKAARSKLLPHPLAGVSSNAQFLLGKTGSLVYSQRKRILRRPYGTIQNIMAEFQAFDEARKLEKQLLMLRIPQKSELIDIQDPDTPMQDLISISDAHRLSALILLYRAFPDLLSTKLDISALQPGNGEHLKSDEDKQQWLTALAIHVLDMLRQSAANSGTRSVEILLLVIIAGELRAPHSSNTNQVQPGNGRPKHVKRSMPPSRALESDLSQGDLSHLLRDFTADYRERDRTDECQVVNARRVVRDRLKAIREILPYKLPSIVEGMISEVWRSHDQGLNVFWIDTMIERGWRYLLV